MSVSRPPGPARCKKQRTHYPRCLATQGSGSLRTTAQERSVPRLYACIVPHGHSYAKVVHFTTAMRTPVLSCFNAIESPRVNEGAGKTALLDPFFVCAHSIAVLSCDFNPSTQERICYEQTFTFSTR